MTSPALDGLLTAFATTQDPRLLVPALDMAADDGELRAVLAAASGLDADALDDDLRLQLADAARDAGDWTLAERFAKGLDSALAIEVEALIEQGHLRAAEDRYRAAIAANPTLEDPGLAAQIADAKAENPDADQSNVIALNRFGGGQHASTAPETEEIAAARLSFTEAGNAIDFSDVGGLDEVKKQISRRIIAPFQKPGLFAKFRRKAGGGVLLYGPPGCGKTLIARATAGECKARFINVPVTDVIDKYVGEPERKLAAIFADARRETPTVLFFDELEALAGRRGHQTSQHEISIVSTFLAELDGFEKNNEGVLILAATNMPWGVDAAFRRSGRFDRLLFIPPPDKGARAAILKLQLAGRPVEDGLDVDAIAARCSGYSGADLENLVNTAADFAIEESIDKGAEQAIGTRHLADALDEVRATTSEWLTTARNFAKYGNNGGQYDEVADFLKKHGK